MANQDLTMIYTQTKSEAELAVAQIRGKYNLPAYLMAGIVEGILSKLKDETIVELSVSTGKYIESLQTDLMKNNEKNEKEEPDDAPIIDIPNS